MTDIPHIIHEVPGSQPTRLPEARTSSWGQLVFKILLLCAFAHAGTAIPAFATCTAPKNAIEAENCLPGNPLSAWYVDGAGSPNIQGFATDISVNVGQTVFFKIATDATAY